LIAIGNLLNFNADYLLKSAHEEAVKNRTRKEWQKAEYEYVEKSNYNLRLYDDLMERMDASENYITSEEYRVFCLGNPCGKFAEEYVVLE
jgi:hypothetical protein